MIDFRENDISPALESWTVQRVLNWAVPWLKGKLVDPVSAPRLEAELLLAFSLQLDRTSLFLQLDRPLNKQERETFKGLIRRRAESEPLAYILGYRDFYRHRFKVNEAVLIPRPDTETLVESLIMAARTAASPRILDVGTGSGCIAISVAAEIPTARVVAWDLSQNALDVADHNASALRVANVSFELRDALVFDNLPIDQYDFIVSNPPYVARDETSVMNAETLRFEPKMALFPNEYDGLTFYRAFASSYGRSLRTGGRIFLEVGFNQAARVAQLFIDAGWQKIEVTKDLSGRDRVISAVWSEP